jgi:hypothetical protein
MGSGDNKDKFWYREESAERVGHYKSSVPAKKDAQTAISNVNSAKRHVEETRAKLGFLEKIRFDRESKEVIRKQLGEIFVNMLEVQKQEIIYRFTLQLDDAKKKAFSAYLEESGKVEGQILRLSNDFEAQLTDFNLEFGMTLWEKKKEREEKLKKLLADGKINQNDHDKEMENIDKWMNIQRNNLSDKIDMMISNHAKQIQRTLELFTERTIRDH